MGDSAPALHCNWVRRCGDGTAFHLEELHFLLAAEGRPHDGRLGGHHLPHEVSKEWYAWVNDNGE